MKKELLSVCNVNNKYWIAGNGGQISGYYKNMKDCTIDMFRICKQMKEYTNIYDTNQREYEKEILGR